MDVFDLVLKAITEKKAFNCLCCGFKPLLYFLTVFAESKSLAVTGRLSGSEQKLQKVTAPDQELVPSNNKPVKTQKNFFYTYTDLTIEI